MKGISIVELQKNDFPRFKEYIKKAFHEKYILSDEKFMRWQYSGDGKLYLAKSGEEIIGHFGYRKVPYKVYDKKCWARFIMNLFTLERFRNVGVGLLLAKKVFDTDDFIINSGYNDSAQKLCSPLRGNWKEAGQLARYVYIIDSRNDFLRKYNAPPSVSAKFLKNEVEVKEVYEMDNSFNDFWKEARHRYHVTVERDKEYLRWRFFRHPLFKYSILAASVKGKLAGYLIYRMEQPKEIKIARIVDLAALPEAETPLFKSFLDYARKDNAHFADFMFSGDFYRESLTDAGFFNVSGTEFEKFPLHFNPVSFAKSKIAIAYDLDSPIKDCYLTRADGDQDRPNPL